MTIYLVQYFPVILITLSRSRLQIELVGMGKEAINPNGTQLRNKFGTDPIAVDVAYMDNLQLPLS